MVYEFESTSGVQFFSDHLQLVRHPDGKTFANGCAVTASTWQRLHDQLRAVAAPVAKTEEKTEEESPVVEITGPCRVRLRNGEVDTCLPRHVADVDPLYPFALCSGLGTVTSQGFEVKGQWNSHDVVAVLSPLTDSEIA